MAVRTYRLGAGQDGNYGALFETDQTAASRTDGWTSAKIASLLAADFDAATKQASGTFVTNTTRPSALITSATANALKIPAALIGTFAATAWTFTFAVRATVVSAQAGRIRLRVYKSKNADGSAAVELTGATQVGTTTAVLSTTVDATSTVTWSPGVTIRLDNEYLFFAIAWEITTAGGSNSADVIFRTGQAAAGTRVVTPDFVANSQLYGVIAMPITFSAAVQGKRTTFSSLVLPISFASFVNGDKFTPAQTYYGSLSMPITFGAVVQGRRQVFGQIVMPITFSKDVKGVRKTFGQITMPITFSKDVKGVRKTFGQIVFPINFGVAVSGYRPGLHIFGSLSMPITFSKDVKGVRKAFGQIAMPIVFTKDVKGIRKTFGKIAMPIVFTKDVRGQKTTFGQVSKAFIFGAVTQGRRRTFSAIAFPINFIADVKTGRIRAHGKIVFPITFHSTIDGKARSSTIVLNHAEMVYLGTIPVQAVYNKDVKVWPQ